MGWKKISKKSKTPPFIHNPYSKWKSSTIKKQSSESIMSWKKSNQNTQLQEIK